ncbi:hypothetical protein ACGFZJ_41820 [Streptomyces sp. NPDC048253]|uniref:hypothetical protein n=1 Tax=Streptomyces sp. NPDC048253 TaxID=3365524 RepID=UPI00131D307A
MQVPGLDDVPDAVCLQKADDFPLDDVVVLNRQGPYQLAVQRQVKRRLGEAIVSYERAGS